MGPSGKWIDGISPDASVVDAARLSLSIRLTTVAHWLPLAAYHADRDVEHVHRLRVSTRRAVAALRLYRDWLSPNKFRWVKKRLKSIRRAAGDARDIDVLAERIHRELGEQAAPVLAQVQELRAAAQPAIVEAAEKCRRDDRFVRKTGQLLDGIRPPRQQLPQSKAFRDWAARQLAQASDVFLAGMPGDDADPAAFHQFRIRAKALRYSIELLATAFGPELREEAYPIVEELQERLGKIQDRVAGAARIRELGRSVEASAVRESLEELAKHEESKLSEHLAELHEWWMAERIESLRLILQRTVERASDEPAAAETPAPAEQPSAADAVGQ